MASLREMRTEIKSVKSTQQVTKAKNACMQFVLRAGPAAFWRRASVYVTVFAILAIGSLFPRALWGDNAYQMAEPKIVASYVEKVNRRIDSKDIQGAYQEWVEFRQIYPTDWNATKLSGPILNAYQVNPSTQSLTSSQLSDLLRGGGGEMRGLLWDRGMDLFHRKQYASAKRYFDRLLQSYPQDTEIQKALFYGAECDFHLKQTEKAASSYKIFIDKYPNDPLAAQAKQRLAELKAERKS